MPPVIPSYESYKQAFSGLRMPFAYVDLDLFDANALSIIQRAKGKPVRIATKSVRCVHLINRALQISPAYQGLMTFTAEETVWLSKLGFDDLLLAYPCWNETQLTEICDEILRGKKIMVMMDSVDHARQFARIAQSRGCVLPICMDLDLSTTFPGLHFGVNRSPVKSPELALLLWREVQKLPSLSLQGLMGYEAQIAGLGDDVPGMGIKGPVVRLLKKQSVASVRDRRSQTVELLKREGAPIHLVNGGGTGSMETTTSEPAVTEITAGSGLFASHLFDYYRNFRHYPAAGFAIEITRMPKPGIYTCLGGGYIASGSIGREKAPLPYLPKGLSLLPNEGAGEVQTPIKYSGMLNLGDPVLFRHSKAGELCERFNELNLFQGDKIVGQVPTYRGEGKCFL